MHALLSDELKKGAKSDTDIEKAIKTVFDQIEADWLKVSTAGFKFGFPQAAYVSTTALVTLVQGNKVYVANAGDSRACLMKVCDDQKIDMKTLNKIHDANNPDEQKRLKKEFPKDQDIYICDTGQNGRMECWVKGG